MTARTKAAAAPPRIIPATVRLDTNPPKATKAQRLRQHRQVAAWRRKAAKQ